MEHLLGFTDFCPEQGITFNGNYSSAECQRPAKSFEILMKQWLISKCGHRTGARDTYSVYGAEGA